MKLPAMCGVIPRTQPGPVVFVGCDTYYAAHHAVPLLYSLDSNSNDVDAHLHVVNPRADLQAALAVMASDLRMTAITQTWENIDLSSFDEHRKATYYACVRFVRAAQLMLACDRPVLVLDADSLIRKAIELPRDCPAGLFLRRDHPPHMAVAAGAVLFTPQGRGFALAAANSIGRALAEWLAGKRDITWYLDQYALAEAYATTRPRVHVFDRTFMDWEFGEDSVIWTGKGPRKNESDVYRAERKKYAARFSTESIRARRWQQHGKLKALILQPCLDLPFKRPRGCVQRGHGVSDLRHHWARFAQNVRAALLGAGWEAVLIERPDWEFTPALADVWQANIVFVPHRERHQFECTTPALFYMQTPIPHLFTVDHRGWGAGHSGYPFDHAAGDPDSDVFDELRERTDRNASKFDQPRRRGHKQLVDCGIIPDAPYIFFPCQIPHDQTVRFHSHIDEVELVSALAAWAESQDVHLVFKEHPANPASMAGLRTAAPENASVHWVGHDEASIHDLIACSAAVYTINSGVGLEAILHGKPVVAFGRAEYRGVTIGWPDIAELSAAWSAACEWSRSDHTSDYRRFIDWFVSRHAFDARSIDVDRLMTKVDGIVRENAEAA